MKEALLNNGLGAVAQREMLPPTDASHLKLKEFAGLVFSALAQKALDRERNAHLHFLRGIKQPQDKLYPEGRQYIVKAAPKHELPDHPRVNLVMNDELDIEVEGETLATLAMLNVRAPNSIEYRPRGQGEPYTLTLDNGALQIDGNVSADDVLQTLDPLFPEVEQQSQDGSALPKERRLNQSFHNGTPFIFAVRNLKNYTPNGLKILIGNRMKLGKNT